MAEITCPMCGKPNPADQVVCQYCEARLKPLTDELSRSQPPIRPGEEPQDLDTGQLESVLPQWLRDIRQQARESTGEEDEQPQAAEEVSQQEEPPDLLTGLQSQSEGEEEIPDWLSGLRGEGDQVDFEETSTDEDDLAALKNMLGEDAPSPQENEPGPLPGWLADREPEETEQAGRDELSSFFAESEETAQPRPEPPASSSGFDWTAGLDTGSPPGSGSSEEDPFETELPAWLQDSDKPGQDQTDSGLPAWMQSEEAVPPSEGEESAPSGAGDLPDWLASLGEQDAAGGAVLPEDTGSDLKSITDRPSSLDREMTGAIPPGETLEPASKGELPAWLSSLGEGGAGEIPAEEPVESEAGDLPGWLADLGEESSEVPPQEPVQPAAEFEAPDWPPSLGEESTIEEEREPATSEEFSEPLQPAPEAELPDWLASLGEATDENEVSAEEEAPAGAYDPETEQAAVTPTFVDDEGEPISADDVDAIFSMDMPDWLSDAQRSAGSDTAPAEAEISGDELRPGELPGWVQAMRPVESVISETEGVPPEEQPLEERGPLAGLRGVLPAIPGVGPTSRPKAYSIRLQASEDQQANAIMLEKILAEEVEPNPVAGKKVLFTQRILRWVIAAVLVVVVGATVYYSPGVNPVPGSVPLETSAVLDYINNSLPANEPVLLVFDYEAARAGEMEAAAAPLIDQMIARKSPRLALVSSTPVGSGLAERFMQILPSDIEYLRNEDFLNLGYLPGGAAGVQAFSIDPLTTKQLATTGESAWTTPVLQDVSRLSDFAAILMLTDDVETARIWVEQTQGDIGETRLLVVASAQASPMIMPYVRSGQVDGMVTGLEGSAPIEGANSGRPGMARRYWDAFGFGLLAAVVMIVLGSLWSLVSSFQALRKEQGQG